MLLFLYVTEEAGRKYVRDMPWPPAAECNMITNKQTCVGVEQREIFTSPSESPPKHYFNCTSTPPKCLLNALYHDVHCPVCQNEELQLVLLRQLLQWYDLAIFVCRRGWP